MKILNNQLMSTLFNLQQPLFAYSGGGFGASSIVFGCRDTCAGSCSGSCSGECEGSCAGECEGSCAGDCEYSCDSECEDGGF